MSDIRDMVVVINKLKERFMSVRLYALVTTQGTAMPETVLTEAEIANPSLLARVMEDARASGDWDGNTMFTDVSDNDYIREMFEE